MSVAKGALVQGEVSTKALSKPLGTMTTDELWRMSTRSLRFAHHLNTSADLTSFPEQLVQLGTPSLEQCEALGIPPIDDNGIVEADIILIPGGRWVLYTAFFILASSVQSQVLCWDLDKLAPSRAEPLLPVAIIERSVQFLSILHSGIAFREEEDDYILFLGGMGAGYAEPYLYRAQSSNRHNR